MKSITLGPEGTFSHQATRTLNPQGTLTFAGSLEEVFSRFIQEDIDTAIVPLENTISGFIEETVINLLKYNFPIVEELYQPINHYLSGWGDPEQAKQILAHPHSYEQCHKTLQRLLPECEVIDMPSNSQAAVELKAKRDPHVVAIVPAMSARIYALPILQEGIQDAVSTVTHFIALGKKSTLPTGDDKTSILIYSEENKKYEGQFVEIFKERKLEVIDLRYLQVDEGKVSLYLLDLVGHHADQEMQKALKILENLYPIKLLGSYPRHRR